MNLLNKKTLSLSTFSVLLASIFLFNGCKKDKGKTIEEQSQNVNSVVNCDTVTFTYNAKVKSIINDNCSSCHSATSRDGSLIDYNSISKYVQNGKLKGRLNGTTGSIMPPSGKLSNCDIKGIENWITKGAKNN